MHAIMPAPGPSLGGKRPRNEANGLDPPAQSPNPLSKSHKARLSNVEMLTVPCMVDHLSKNSWDQLTIKELGLVGDSSTLHV